MARATQGNRNVSKKRLVMVKEKEDNFGTNKTVRLKSLSNTNAMRATAGRCMLLILSLESNDIRLKEEKLDDIALSRVKVERKERAKDP